MKIPSYADNRKSSFTVNQKESDGTYFPSPFANVMEGRKIYSPSDKKKLR